MARFWCSRSTDSGTGEQVLQVNDSGIVVSQALVGRGVTYTGDGNPEVVGKSIRDLRGWGFRKGKEVDPEDYQ